MTIKLFYFLQVGLAPPPFSFSFVLVLGWFA